MRKYCKIFLFMIFCFVNTVGLFTENINEKEEKQEVQPKENDIELNENKEKENSEDQGDIELEKTEMENEKDFNICISDSIPMLHPHISYNADEAQLLTALYEGLFVYDPKTLEPIGGIAESWKVTGGRTWRFILRENAKFENGDAITATTFKDSWLNLLSPELNCPYASLLDCIDGVSDWRNGKLKNKNQIGIQVESERVLTVYTSSPCQYLPLILCHHAFSAVHPSQLKDVAKFMNKKEFKKANEAFKPISSGPFKIEEFDNDKIVFTKNEKYWDSSFVRLSRINNYFNIKEEDISYKFNLGEIHWLNKASIIKDVAYKEAVHIGAMFSTEYFFFRVDTDATKNERIREALLLAIPYEKLRSQYLIPASTLVFPLPDYPHIQGIDEYNIYKAKNIMGEIKLNDKNKKIKIIFPENTYYEPLVKILKEAWEDLGFIIEEKQYAPKEYYEVIKKPGYSLAVLSWIADFADPTSFLEMFRPLSNINYTVWENAEYESMLRLANAETETGVRYKKLAEVEKLLLASNIIIPLSHNPSVNVIDLDYISGWYPNAINIHPFKFVKFKKKKNVLPGLALQR